MGSSTLARLLLVLLLTASLAPAWAVPLQVSVTGLSGEYEENVLALLAIYQERNDDSLTVGRIESLHRRASEQIKEALAPFGLYRVEIDAQLTPPATKGAPWVATYRIDPGPPIRIATVDYELTGAGAEDPDLPKTFPLKVGEVLNHEAYEKAKGDLRYALAQGGYLDYRLGQHQVLIDPDAYVAIVDVAVDTGPRYYYGEVRFKQDLLDERFLQRYVPFEAGDIYDPDQLLRLQGRLLGSEYFERVEIEPLRGAGPDPQTVPIEVVARRNKANKYRIGLGFATDVGARMSLEWQRRYIGRFGHKFSTEISLAQQLQQLSAEYKIPVGDPMRDFISIQPAFESYDTATGSGELVQIQAAYSSVTDRGWRRTIGLDFRHEDYELDEGDSDTVFELTPNISWAKTVSDDPIYTKRGYRVRATALGSLEGVVSPTSYLSALAQVKWIRAFAERYRVIARSDLGITLADSLDDLAASRRFFAGGDSSIRGWGLDALGPTDPQTDKTVGGRYLAVGSLELERQIKGPWSAALFTDFGNAFDPDRDYDQKWQQSVGLGLHWKSPIGQVRADVAFALTKDNDDGGLPPARLHITIGPDL
ncbi:outer membrane protein [Thioflavicoccus mobilis 8321]|uniref:Translocation and assembly module subunit TamA n=1 Tax=Thioflavicoccus mobilis 8321 TaxID=765912 RepID=L0GVE6_9GAMM|nr:autotransporter assembly complex family protein [Thioflavicoccus mobilis]AGA89274.1 outer membrane protein [Thioflavicoccus mobilis 8321]